MGYGDYDFLFPSNNTNTIVLNETAKGNALFSMEAVSFGKATDSLALD